MSDEFKRANAKSPRNDREAAIAEVRRQKAVGKALDIKAALEAVRGGPLDLQAAAAFAQGDLSRLATVFWVQAQTLLLDRAVTAPNVQTQVDAADKAAGRAHNMMALIAEAQGRIGPPVVVQSQGAAADDGVSREEKIAILRAQMKLVGRG